MDAKFKAWTVYILIIFISLSQPFDQNSSSDHGLNCQSRSECNSGRGSRLDLSLDWQEKNCFCDDACIEYGDCCSDAKVYDSHLMQTAHTRYECINLLPFGSFYMRGRCMDGWEGSYSSELCQKASPQKDIHRDPFLDMPVTSLASDVTYKNYYCAVCNNETLEDLEVWHAQVSCQNKVHHNESLLKEHLQYVNNSWGLYLNNSDGTSETFFACHVYPIIKETIIHKVRHCKEYVSNCDSEWENFSVAHKCQSYTSLVYGPPPNENSPKRPNNKFELFSSQINSVAYRNYHCALCNYINETDLACYERHFRQVPFSPISFSVLFDFGVENLDCKNGEIWDPFSKTCRLVVCQQQNYQFVNGKCEQSYGELLSNISQLENAENTSLSDLNNEEKEKMKCDKLFINESDFIRGKDGAIKISIFRRTYDADEYKPYKEGILVCIPESYSRLMGWLSMFGMGLSCLCITVHLLTFIFVQELRNLSGKNLSSMCLSLLIAYISFLIASLKENGANSCPWLASSMYYFFLASFTWMNVMAYDIWKTLQRATVELRLTKGKQWKKFLYYSLYAWLTPLLALVFVLIIDNTEPAWMDPSYLPEFGNKLCWFGKRKAILVYFAAPLALIMVVNIIFFFLAVKMVAVTTQSTTTLTCSQPHQTRLKLYLRVALLMGLSWISGIIAGYIQEEYMWYLFILLNAFQGLYILMGFTLTKKVFRAIKSTRSLRSSYRNSGSSRKLPIRQNLESQDSQLSNTSSTSLSTNVSNITSKSSLHLHSPHNFQR